MEKLNCVTIETAQRWALTLVESDDPSIILNDKRGGYKKDLLYDVYPELESDAKAFAINETAKKNCAFNVDSLSKFIHMRYQELSGVKIESKERVRSNFS